MIMDSFLDTNVIFSYSNHTLQSNEIVKKCYSFIINKHNKFIICGAVLEELQEVIKKRIRIHKAVIEKIKDSKYLLENSHLISKRDVPIAKQLYEQFKNSGIRLISERFADERDISEIVIQKFLENQVDEKVMPLEQVQTELVNKIHDILSNHADCKIVASALQLQKNREIFLFVTADSKDLAPNGYDYLKEHFKINYLKEGHKFPELLNLMFTK